MINNTVTSLDRLMNDGRPDQLPEMLDAVKRTVLELLAGMPRPVQRLQLSAGPISVELDWPEPDVQVSAHPVVAGEARPEPRAQVDDEQLDHIHATTVGIFYRAPEPGARPFVVEGDVVAPGQTLGLIEAMKLMIPVEADRRCRIVEFLAPNGTPVEYGDPLFAVVPVDEE